MAVFRAIIKPSRSSRLDRYKCISWPCFITTPTKTPATVASPVARVELHQQQQEEGRKRTRSRSRAIERVPERDWGSSDGGG